jgi:hypothetical protein
MNPREARLKKFENEEHPRHLLEGEGKGEGNEIPAELLDEEEALKRAMELSLLEGEVPLVGESLSSSSSGKWVVRCAAFFFCFSFAFAHIFSSTCCA